MDDIPDTVEVECERCGKSHEFYRSIRCIPTHHSIHARERAVVWQHPVTGEVTYPPQNDVPMPARYAKQGFQRRELNSLKEVEAFEREQGVRSEKAWFDSGSGRSFDSQDPFGLPKEVQQMLDDGTISIKIT